MDYAILVLIALVIGGGVTGGVIRAWSLHAELRRLRDEVGALHDRIQSEQKKRAANGRWSNQDIKEELKTAPLEQVPWFWGAH